MPRNSRSDYGCIERVDRGRYRVRWWADLHDGKGYRRVSRTVRGTRQEAAALLASMQLKHNQDGPVPTFSQAWEGFVLPVLQRRFESGEIVGDTVDHYTAAWKNHIEPTWGSVPVTDAKPVAIQEWLDTMTKSQAEEARIPFRMIFNECNDREICSTEVAYRKYRLPAPGSEHDKGTWGIDELRSIWLGSKGTYLERWFILAAFGGPRVSESLGARCSEVELVEFNGVPVAIVPIKRQAKKRRGVTNRLKTPWSWHAAVIPGPLGLRLYDLCSNTEDEWLLDIGIGEPIGRERLRDRFDRLLAKIGVERHPVRNLRPSWQTFTKWTLNVDPAKIERMLGHAGKDVTQRHYDRPEALMLAEAIARAYAEHPYADGWLDTQERT